MKKNVLLISLVSTIAAGVIIYFFIKRSETEIKKRHVKVAEEGYETAYDILYPLKG